MAYILALMSAAATGSIFALGALALGIDHRGVLFAIAIIGAGLQTIALMLWYLHYTSDRPVTPPVQEPN